jgi:uncharacterized repeat protein (TIGR01451 family)
MRRRWPIALLAASGCLALPATAVSPPGTISLTREPSPPSAITPFTALDIEFEVTFSTVPSSLRFQVNDPSGNVIYEEPIAINSGSIRDVRQFALPAGAPAGRYVVRYIFEEVEGFEAEAAAVFDVATDPLANWLREVVFHDVNGNGVRDAGEDGVPSWLLRLTNPTGDAVQLFTGADGTRTDNDVPSGTWQIGTATDPGSAGWLPTTPTSSAIDVPSDGSATWEMGLARPTAITGTVFIDANQNGDLDTDEARQQGVPLSLTGTTGAGAEVTDTAASGADGGYRFENLLPGTYQVRVGTPDGFLLTTVEVHANLTTTSGGTLGNNDFGLIQTGSLTMLTFHDRNMSGAQEAGEEGIPGWTFSYSRPPAGGEATQTGPDGTIVRTGLLPGGYSVTGAAPDPAEWITTTARSGSVDVPPNGGGQFALGVVAPTTICGTVFIDEDQSATLDTGEPTQAGATVTLEGTDLAGQEQRTAAISDGNGGYCFSVPPGTYRITITTPDGLVLTTPATLVGIETGSGDQSNDNNFGLFAPAPTGDLAINVFHDRNMNGEQNAGEEGVANWGLTRTGPRGTTAASTTGASGLITHNNVLAGPWVVSTRDNPVSSGWQATTPTNAAVNVPENGVGRFDMGIVRQAMVCGVVFIDANENGKRDPDEAIKAGARIDLAGTDLAGSSQSETTTSGTDGKYCFTVPPGSYQVRISTPGGFRLTTVQVRTGITPGSGATRNGNDFGLIAPAPVAPSPRGDADLRVSKTAPSAVRRGRPFTFRIVVRNPTRYTARNVVLIDPIPDTMSLVAKPAGATVSNGIITWRLGSIRAGGSKTRTFRALINPQTPLSSVRNFATATADGVPPRSDDARVRVTDPPPAPRSGGVTG